MHQLRSSGAKALFTCVPLLKTALAAAREVGIQEERVFIIPLPNEDRNVPFKSVDDLISLGKSLPPFKAPRWVAGQGSRTTAFLSYSSGTSGFPVSTRFRFMIYLPAKDVQKAVKISHHNVISNILQLATFESVDRKKKSGVETQVSLGVLPFSHIYGLVTISHLANYRGDAIIVLPRFELRTLLQSIQRFRIEQMSIVPPILIQMLTNRELCNKFDLSSMRFVFTGAAPLGSETAKNIMEQYPKWNLGQGYGESHCRFLRVSRLTIPCVGLTEASPSVSHTSESDILLGSSGSLLPGTKAKVVDLQGQEVTEYDTPGELFVQSPSVTLGYLNNEKANAETFQWHHDGLWLRTGDEVVMRKSPLGNEHCIVVDRIKELIKVKVLSQMIKHNARLLISFTLQQGHQVAPAELEAHLLDHPFVADCAVIGIPDDRAGEIPKAFVVKNQEANGKTDQELAAVLREHVESHKAKHKWLKGGIDFVESIPKSPSGKILRRILRDAQQKRDIVGIAKL